MATHPQSPPPQSTWLDLALRTLGFVMSLGAILLLWVDLITVKGAILLLGIAVISLVLDRFR
jgi:hypothetical protein